VGQVHGDVGHLHLIVLEALTLHTVVDHDVTERARGRDARGARRDQLLRALDVHLLAHVLFHPHASTTGATAHALRRLDDVDPAERTDHLSWREVHVVVAAEVAAVVVDDPLVELRFAQVELTGLDQELE
jgi:hypothetical protein